MKKIGLLLVAVAFTAASCDISMNPNPPIANPPAAVLFSEPVQSIYEFAKKVSGLKLMAREPDKVWWISNDGYSILNDTENIFTAEKYLTNAEMEKFLQDGLSAIINEESFQTIVVNARAEFVEQGFKKDSVNSSLSTQDDRFVDYVEAYARGETICTITISGDIGSPLAAAQSGNYNQMSIGMSVACADNFDENYAEQQPILEGLGLRNKDSVIRIAGRSGNFVRVNAHHRRTGYYSILKLENGKYVEIYSGQDITTCDVIDKWQVPKDIYGDCWDEQTNKPRGQT